MTEPRIPTKAERDRMKRDAPCTRCNATIMSPDKCFHCDDGGRSADYLPGLLRALDLAEEALMATGFTLAAISSWNYDLEKARGIIRSAVEALDG